MPSLLVLPALLLLVSPAFAEELLEPYREAATEKWAEDIAEFEAADAELAPDPETLLFVGSSSFRLWKTMGEDLAPYKTVNRGFGGSKWSDLAIFADRLIKPHRFRAAAFFVANDIKGEKKEEDKTPEEIAELVTYVLARVRAHEPEAHLFLIATTPTEKRLAAWPEIRKANEAVKMVCAKVGNATFIETEDLYLDAEGKPRSELFLDDRLHLNDDGYKLWEKRIRKHLDQVFGKER